MGQTVSCWAYFIKREAKRREIFIVDMSLLTMDWNSKMIILPLEELSKCCIFRGKIVFILCQFVI
jgi:hypothetical protein